jgi:hypothetical protein
MLNSAGSYKFLHSALNTASICSLTDWLIDCINYYAEEVDS